MQELNSSCAPLDVMLAQVVVNSDILTSLPDESDVRQGRRSNYSMSIDVITNSYHRQHSKQQ